MKTKGFLKGLFGLFLGLGIASSAHAVTLVKGESYILSGNVRGNLGADSTYTGAYSLLNTSYFTYNFDNTISIVLNLTQSVALGSDKATLVIDRLNVSGNTLTGAALTAPTGVQSFGTFKDIGNFFPTDNPTNFTNFAIMKNGLLKSNTNDLKFWGIYFTQAGGQLGSNVDFHLKIGGIRVPPTPPGQVPEPMSMSLLGMGLIGGIINRRKKATA